MCGESKKKKQVEANTVKELSVELELGLAQLQVRLVFNLHRANQHRAKMAQPLGQVNNAYVRICGLGDNITGKMHSQRENLKTGTNLLGSPSVIFRPLVLGNYNYTSPQGRTFSAY